MRASMDVGGILPAGSGRVTNTSGRVERISYDTDTNFLEKDAWRGRAETAEAELKAANEAISEQRRELVKYITGLEAVPGATRFNRDVARDLREIVNGD